MTTLWFLFFFFFNDTATTEIYTLSLHDALPIFLPGERVDHRTDGHEVRHHLRGDLLRPRRDAPGVDAVVAGEHREDRKSTRLNSSHANISYAVFCLKKKNTDNFRRPHTLRTQSA